MEKPVIPLLQVPPVFPERITLSPEQNVVGPAEEIVTAGSGFTVATIPDEVLLHPFESVTLTLYVFDTVGL